MQALDKERTARLHGLLLPMHLDAALMGSLVLHHLRRQCTSAPLRQARIEPPPPPPALADDPAAGMQQPAVEHLEAARGGYAAMQAPSGRAGALEDACSCGTQGVQTQRRKQPFVVPSAETPRFCCACTACLVWRHLLPKTCCQLHAASLMETQPRTIGCCTAGGAICARDTFQVGLDSLFSAPLEGTSTGSEESSSGRHAKRRAVATGATSIQR